MTPVTLKLTNAAAQLLRAALVALDGRDGVPFKLGALRLDIVDNVRRLDARLALFNRAQGDLVNQYKPQDADRIRPTDQNWNAFLAEFAPLMAREDEIELVAFPRAALRLDENDVPLATLEVLFPLISGEAA